MLNVVFVHCLYLYLAIQTPRVLWNARTSFELTDQNLLDIQQFHRGK
jgi:hypothetical protein